MQKEEQHHTDQKKNSTETNFNTPQDTALPYYHTINQTPQTTNPSPQDEQPVSQSIIPHCTYQHTAYLRPAANKLQMKLTDLKTNLLHHRLLPRQLS